ncbi:MAG: glycosyltransferase family 9 protein [Candidatus Obscuribacterales bacterium]|nr:glycosyltransferase family 9 protein [Candidatus Obscuribacterales bacterium]
MERILVYHKAAIGDSVLATPVSVKLKKQFPDAKISYLTHESLVPLLSLCPAIDEFISLEKNSGFGDLRMRINERKPQLLVDLSGSSSSFFQTLLSAGKVLRYQKKEKSMHAVDNYLETIAEICPVSDKEVFPTLFLSDSEKDRVRKMLNKDNRRLIALVPGVGLHRPHRAWPEESWLALCKHILWEKDHALILIGGSEERTLCSRIAERVGDFCFNLAGRLNLAETAAALSLCDATVSGDTGPAHISVAVGTPVVGLYGPTLLERSGPYGCNELSISTSEKCRCLARKNCVDAKEQPGTCMKGLPMKIVYGSLSSLFPWNRV